MFDLGAVCLALLGPLAVWMVISGLDDLFIAAAWLFAGRRWPAQLVVHGDSRLNFEQRRIAVFIPLWQEDAVIRQMLEHNLAALRYDKYQVFVGAYPNDPATLRVVRECEDRFERVHLVVCPRGGPTSKADCLNWIWSGLLAWERRHKIRFNVVVVHDAEDLMHPEELQAINYYSRAYGMVQVPVLPLASPFWSLTHGVYCDEFAEYQTKDIPARQALGGFLPSNGVGTGYARWALELMAEGSDRVFDPDCVTEDYDFGYRLHRLGCPQVFIGLEWDGSAPAATREYFPTRIRPALRQRARWVAGIALQCWERHGWRGGWKQGYWLWRDRKGLIGNPATLLANAVTLYASASWILTRDWTVGRAIPDWLLIAAVVLQGIAIVLRGYCCGRIYGWLFALGVPVRICWANWLNAAATLRAAAQYTVARARHARLQWLKTDHVFPEKPGTVHSNTISGEKSAPPRGAGYIDVSNRTSGD